MLLLAAGGYLVCSKVQSSAPAVSKRAGSAAVAVEAPPAQAATEPAQRQEDIALTLVVDAATDQPLRESSLTLSDAADPGSTLTAPLGVTADEAGRIRLSRQVLPGRALLFRAPHHVPQAIANPAGTPDKVMLQQSGTLELSVIDAAGHPVTDACAVLSGKPDLPVGSQLP